MQKPRDTTKTNINYLQMWGPHSHIHLCRPMECTPPKNVRLKRISGEILGGEIHKELLISSSRKFLGKSNMVLEAS